MKHLRLHRKVFLWWGRFWAVQLIAMPEFALGLRVQPRRPLLDLYLGPLTIALGRDPVRTDQAARQADSCRGFLVQGEEVL